MKKQGLRFWGLGIFLAVVAGLWAETPATKADADTGAQLKQALAGRQVVTFLYNGHVRTVEPHALGKGTADKPVLLAWQTAGGSNTEPPSGWRVFLLAEIRDLKVTEETFAKPRADAGAKGRGLKSIEVEVAPATEAAGTGGK